MSNKFVFHSDPVHGWLQVPKELILALEIRSKITGFSYQDEEYMYLEEDCDAPLFRDAYEARFGEEPEIVVKHYNNECFVRGL